MALRSNPSEKHAPIAIVRPRTPSLEMIRDRIDEVLTSGMLTNGRYVQQFECEIAEYLQVDHAVAVSSCTTGLIMSLSVLGLRGEIIVPSFSFSATGHVCFWAGLTPVFVDCDDRDWTISLTDTMAAARPTTAAILAAHTFGNPADVGALEEFAAENGLVLVFDAAHGIGSQYRGRRLGGAGHASVFSLTPTKLITAGEGGIITTNDPHLARELRTFRNYGDSGNYDCTYIGLNGRMPEMSAILGLATLANAQGEVAARNAIAEKYHQHLASVPGIICQHVQRDNISSYKDFTVVVDERVYGCTRDQLATLLADENIATRKYFSPPLHQQSAYEGHEFRHTALKATETISRRTLTLPMHSSLGDNDIKRVCRVMAHAHAQKSGAPTAAAPAGVEPIEIG